MPIYKTHCECGKRLLIPTWKKCTDCDTYKKLKRKCITCDEIVFGNRTMCPECKFPKTRYNKKPIDDDVYVYLVDEEGDKIGYMTKKKRNENITKFYINRNSERLPLIKI